MTRYSVKYLVAGTWIRYGIPFGTVSGAIACAARLKTTEGLTVKIEEAK